MRRSRRVTSRSGTFNPEDVKRVSHTRLGVWDLYEERAQVLGLRIPGTSRLEHYLSVSQSLPYVWKMLKDISGIQNCWLLLLLYLTVEFIKALLPATSLWYSGQLLGIVQTAVESRTVDKNFLLHVSIGRIACAITERLLDYAKRSISFPLQARLKQHYAVHLFQARARLDLPTFEDPAVQRQLEDASGTSRGSIAWTTFQMISTAGSTAVQIVSQTTVLARILREQQDGPLLASISLLQSVFDWLGGRRGSMGSNNKKRGLHQNARLKTSEFKRAAQRVGDKAADFWEIVREQQFHEKLTLTSLLKDCWRELPQIVFALRAVQHPAHIPVSLASLNLIQGTTQRFGFTMYRFMEQFGSIADQLGNVRKLYEVVNISNKIPDGTVPFPEVAQKVKTGVSVEFRNVSYRYPGTDEYAIRDVSFKVGPGELCVIVGANGSGKSTILKLIVRLYDPEEGEILINGQDIRTLKLADLRQAVSVLFQDYTHFPLSIRDNIALGNPSEAANDEHVRLAARLGGAEEFIERLPEGFDTYLNRPVSDYYSGLPEGTHKLFGRPVDYSAMRFVGNMSDKSTHGLSGGQMQRLAVARMFMRSIVTEDSPVGLLLFDEPSASLDPTAEHDLFARLRDLRGNKTMIFSSHRFGNLTRHADLILYINDSVIVETGTHNELLKHGGEYARIWSLQAEAFL
ncbi:predicted protein [Postia placenta Mad-698-R]|uniref:ABC transporter domain-containing protein n=1 Tax=Postia placenta MAD-698-R-SB12 TaxID=670580 RepID=A0A1X6NHL6_9APHY|nr:hypothetical protein POSPLADRAFT_1177131 [Postia placenta MAD-698-R-SB12]EED84781.1 predicted protein [Postia placenta Mad-698-R]OSX68111.1 hypothetical protein POSPLADRAFT_1177131 [Postia placenta MAD-698-R-SB12]